MKISHAHRKPSGVSIIEVLIVVAIAAILTGIAIPAFNVFIGNTRTSTIANEFVSALNLARSEAMKRGQDVSVCPRNTAGDGCDVAQDWEKGWLVLSETDNSLVRAHEGYQRPDGSDEPSRFSGAGKFANAKLTYDRTGRLINPSDTIDEDNDYFKIDNMGKTMCIYVNNSGRIRSQKNC